MQNLYEMVKTWPFIEAKHILTSINNKTPEKGYVLFETGYGPSGIPHIGTFGEVARTTMVMHAFKELAPNIPIRLICFSDDMDGLRKVPDNIPNQQMLRQFIGRPLTDIPDPYEKFSSYGEYMNNQLKQFLDSFGFEYEFKSATKTYKSGEFDKALLKILKYYEEIKSIIIPTLREERAKTYSPFMPISPKTYKVIENGVKSINQESATIKFLDDDGEELEIPITGGNCKLQWKVDFGMRWYAFKVDYEMYGKDIIHSAELASKICKVLGGNGPINFHYELFLDEQGQKISKSKGNGLSIEEWLRYAPHESLSYYMFAKPKRAKRLYFDVIPKTVDEYISFAKKYKDMDKSKRLESPIWYIHKSKNPNIHIGNISFNLLINLAAACNPEDKSVLLGFIQKYDSQLLKNDNLFLDQLVVRAINYYEDFIKPNKKYRMPNEKELKAINELKQRLEDCSTVDAYDGVAIQNMVYDIGNQNEFDLKLWFKALYEILLGQSQGPRIGSFIALYGIKETISLIDQAVIGKLVQ